MTKTVTLKRDPAGTDNKSSLREILYRLPIHRISVCRIDDRYLAERILPGSKTLAGLKVGLVGCGTIGGYLVEMLAKAGAGTIGGKLTLVDMGSLEPGNLGRHRLGFSALIKKKAEAMCDELRRVAPGIDAVAVVGDVKAVNLGPLDLLIDATGEQGLTDWLTWKYADKVPFLSAWVEGSGLAVRALLKAKPEYACARCVSQPPLRDQYRVFDVPPEVIMKVMAAKACTSLSLLPRPYRRLLSRWRWYRPGWMAPTHPASERAWSINHRRPDKFRTHHSASLPGCMPPGSPQ